MNVNHQVNQSSHHDTESLLYQRPTGALSETPPDSESASALYQTPNCIPYDKLTPNDNCIPYDKLNLMCLKDENSRGYFCPICNRYLRDKFNFREHYMYHSGEKAFRCDHCSYGCMRKKQLYIHMMNKHLNMLNT